MSKFFPASGFKWTDLQEFHLNKYLGIVQKDVFLKMYPLAPDNCIL